MRPYSTLVANSSLYFFRITLTCLRFSCNRLNISCTVLVIGRSVPNSAPPSQSCVARTTRVRYDKPMQWIQNYFFGSVFRRGATLLTSLTLASYALGLVRD